MLDFLIKSRADQLQEEKNIDKKLLECPCQNLVAKYLLLQRKINRDRYEKIENDGFLHTFSNLKQNLKEIDKEHERIVGILNSPDPCKKLSAYMSP